MLPELMFTSTREPEYKIIGCPDCEGGGKVLKHGEITGLFMYKKITAKTDKDCPRCGGFGKLKVDVRDIQSG